MFTSTTVQQIIDRARVRHWSFADLVLGDGAVLAYLSQRLRTHLAAHGSAIEGLVNTTMTYDVVSVAGLLIAEVAGVPQVATTYQDGWPIHLGDGLIDYPDPAIDAVTTKFKTTAIARYIIANAQATFAITTGLTFSAAHAVNANKFGIILVQIDGAEVVSTKVPASPQAYNTAPLALAALPAPDAGNVELLHIAIAAGAGGWTANADALTGVATLSNGAPAVPYYDATEPMVATDPYGLHGGTPGFPLPSEMVRLIDVSLTYSQPPGITLPCDIIQEHGRIQAQPGRNPQAFVSGNRLVPMMPFTSSVSGANSANRWFNVNTLIMSYVALPTLTRITDYLNIPGVLVEALDADAALMMARQSKAMPAAGLAAFEREAAAVASTISDAGLEMLHEPEDDTVQYRG